MKYQKIIFFLSIILINTLRAQTNTINISWWYVGGWQGGGCGYVINGEDDPILYLYRGQSYSFNINTFGHPIIIDGIIEAIDEGIITITIPDNTPDVLNYHCLYTCSHPNGFNHNCWSIDPLHEFDAGNLVIIQQSPTSVNIDFNSNYYELKQNFPNPFNPKTVINYQIPITVKVTLKVYNVLGKEIAELVNEQKSAGVYEASWDASSLTSGVYIYTIQAGNFIQTKKMILLK